MKTRWRCLALLCLAMMMLTACTVKTPAPAPTPTVPETGDTATEVPAVFTLAYSRADSLDPYKMTSRVNRELVTLLYEGLTVMDVSMHPQPALAAEVQVEGKTVTAVLAEGAVFSDGTAVTAEDVLSSFAAARECEAYRTLLSNVAKAEATEDGRRVIFTLAEPDPYAAACLSFPVIRTAEDGTVLGSGRYVFDPMPRLTANPHGGAVAFSEIRLLDLVNDDECLKGVELGNVSYFYSDLTDGDVPRVSRAVTAVDTEYMVYLGINSSRELFRDAAVRRAVSLALDRTRLAEYAFAGYAAAATAPFPVPFAAAEQLASFSSAADREGAAALLGWEEGETAEISLLVCEDTVFKTALADLIKTDLEAVGFTVNVVSLPYEDYFVALRNGRCDLYIGEIRLTANMDLSPLLGEDGAVSYGIDTDGVAAESYAAFRRGEITAADFAAAMAEDLPYIPVCWRRGLAAYDRKLIGVTPWAFNAYADPENWKWSAAEA